MKKNKKIILLILYFSTILILIIKPFSKSNTNENPTPIKTTPTAEIPIKKDGINIGKIQEKFQNNDIIGYIKIPDVVLYPVLQTDNNDYYINHNIKKEDDIKGSIFMDYRVTFEDRKILIYGHSGKEQDLPFLPLNRYTEEEFFKNNKIIYLYSKEKKYTYEIFSSYIEAEDYDFVNIQKFNGLSWLEHINKLKSKSIYQVNNQLTEDTKILILQTCSMDEGIATPKGKYHLVIAALKETQNNNYE